MLSCRELGVVAFSHLLGAGGLLEVVLAQHNDQVCQNRININSSDGSAFAMVSSSPVALRADDTPLPLNSSLNPAQYLAFR